ETTGKSLRHSTDDAKIAKVLSEEDLHLLSNCDVITKDVLLKLANIDDVAKRAEAVKMVCLGMAISDVLAEIANAKPASKEPKAPKEEDLNDTEWLAKYCHTVRSRLQSTTSFDRDALFYRHSL